MFLCSKCGKCCQTVGQSSIYMHLDRGDGTCKFFDDITKLCTIYEQRPLICNIDKTYDQYFKNHMSLQDYYELNYKACQLLKENAIVYASDVWNAKNNRKEG